MFLCTPIENLYFFPILKLYSRDLSLSCTLFSVCPQIKILKEKVRTLRLVESGVESFLSALSCCAQEKQYVANPKGRYFFHSGRLSARVSDLETKGWGAK